MTCILENFWVLEEFEVIETFNTQPYYAKVSESEWRASIIAVATIQLEFVGKSLSNFWIAAIIDWIDWNICVYRCIRTSCLKQRIQNKSNRNQLKCSHLNGSLCFGIKIVKSVWRQFVPIGNFSWRLQVEVFCTESVPSGTSTEKLSTLLKVAATATNGVKCYRLQIDYLNDDP